MEAELSHLSDKELELYRERRGAPAELVAADDHLSTCSDCFARLGDDRRELLSLMVGGLTLQGETAREHLTFEQMSDYVDGRLERIDEAALEGHVRDCKLCENEVRDLLSVKEQVNENAGRVYAPSLRPFVRPVSSVSPRRPKFLMPLQIAAGLAAVLLLAWAISLPLRSQIADLRAQVEQLQRSNEDLTTQSTAAREMERELEDLKRRNADLQRDYEGAAQIAVSLSDGDGRVTLDRQGILKGVEALSAEDQKAVREALVRQRVELPSGVRSLAGQSGTLMGLDDRSAYGLVSPVGTVVQGDRPTLRWRPLAGATSYVATIYARGFKVVATSGSMAATEWAVPTPLERGGTYSWQVRAVVDGKETVMPPPQAPEARFKVLERARLAEIERARKAYARSHLALGVLYAKLGLLDDAEHELRALLDANPKSPVAERLLRSVVVRLHAAAPGG